MSSGADRTASDQPVVTVILLTYNHEAFITRALAGILEQEAPFAVELIVTEDCSTDSTLEVIQSVCEQSDQEILVLTSPTNFCSNIVFRRALDKARGEFVATLDGDDYWTDPKKLVRQVEFLRERPDFAMCYHDVVQLDDATGEEIEHTPLGTTEFTQCDLVLGNPIPGCSALFRRTAIHLLPASFDDAEFGDLPLYLEAVRHGRIGGIGATMGVYRLHAGGIWTGTATEVRMLQTLRFLDRLDPSVKRSCQESLAKGRGNAMRRVAEALLDQGRRREARGFAYRSLALPGPPGYGRRMSLGLVARATSPVLFKLVRRARGRLGGRR